MSFYIPSCPNLRTFFPFPYLSTTVNHSQILLILPPKYFQNYNFILTPPLQHLFWITCHFSAHDLIFLQSFHICSSRLVSIYVQVKCHVLCEFFPTLRGRVNPNFFHFTIAHCISVAIIYTYINFLHCIVRFLIARIMRAVQSLTSRKYKLNF